MKTLQDLAGAPWVRRHVDAIHMVALWAVGVLFLAPSLGAGFVGDNLAQIISPDLLHLDHGYVRPLFVLSLKLDRLLWGAHPAGFHFTNLVLHLVNCSLLYLLALRITRLRPVSAAASWLFLLHPVHSLDIFWISGRCDMICCLFYTASLLCFVGRDSVSHKAWLWSSVLLYALSLLSKEMALSFVPVAWLYLLMAGREPDIARRGAVRLVPHVVVTLVYLAARAALLRDQWMANVAHQTVTVPDVVRNLASYLGLLVIPGGHMAIGDFLRSHPGVFTACALVSCAAGAALIYAVRRSPFVILCAAAVAVSLVPVLRLMMRWYLYIPSLSFCLLAAYALKGTEDRNAAARKLRAGLLLFVLAVCACFLWREQGRWLESGRMATMLSNEIAGVVKAHSLKRLLLLNTVAESDEVPVLMFNTSLNVNLALYKCYDSLEVTPVDVSSSMSLRGSDAPKAVRVRCDRPGVYRIECVDNRAYFSFPDDPELGMGRVRPESGMELPRDNCRLRIAGLDCLGRVNAMEVSDVKPGFPVAYFSEGRILVDTAAGGGG